MKIYIFNQMRYATQHFNMMKFEIMKFSPQTYSGFWTVLKNTIIRSQKSLIKKQRKIKANQLIPRVKIFAEYVFQNRLREVRKRILWFHHANVMERWNTFTLNVFENGFFQNEQWKRTDSHAPITGNLSSVSFVNLAFLIKSKKTVK